MHVPFLLRFFSSPDRRLNQGCEAIEAESPAAGTNPHSQTVKESIRLTTGF